MSARLINLAMPLLVLAFFAGSAQNQSMNKEKLDQLLERHKAQPVGVGYIDIIVTRENYKKLVTDLIKNGFRINAISWWEWCEGEKKNQFGLGGPKSRYYNGWFSELSVDLNEIPITTASKEEEIQEVINVIETKSISLANTIVTFKQSTWLTPGLWLDVPEEWKNKHGH